MTGEPLTGESPAGESPAGESPAGESPAGGSLAAQMRAAAAALLGSLDDDQQRAAAALPFGGLPSGGLASGGLASGGLASGGLASGGLASGGLASGGQDARRWLEYRPRPRPGACLAGLSGPARKAAHRLLATGLSEHAYAAAMIIESLEEVLDRREGWRRGRHSGDYYVAVFGEPGGGEPWSWRFEGHHLSVTMTVSGEEVSPAPVFLGANPAQVSYAGRPVSRPLGAEEDLVRELMDALGPDGRAAAVVASEAPGDIRTAQRPDAGPRIEPAGIAAGGLGPTARALLDQLVAVYLDRLPAGLAAREAARARAGELHFAWEGPLTPGARHYYRVQGDALLIEYDTTDDGNHAHTVLRRPGGDFGTDLADTDLLGAHLRDEHAASRPFRSKYDENQIRGGSSERRGQ